MKNQKRINAIKIMLLLLLQRHAVKRVLGKPAQRHVVIQLPGLQKRKHVVTMPKRLPVVSNAVISQMMQVAPKHATESLPGIPLQDVQNQAVVDINEMHPQH